LTNAEALAAQGVTPDLLASTDWRVQMAEGREAPSQTLTQSLVDRGFAGMLAPSNARLTPPQARNLILWRWSSQTLQLIDDEARLKQP
jgi:RES domain-containing protein